MFPDQKFTDAEIAFVAALKEDSGMEWVDIAEKFNKKFKQGKSAEAIRKGYTRAKDRIANNTEYVKLFRSVNQTKKANSLNSKDLRHVLTAWDQREDILEAIKAAARDVNKVKTSALKVKKGKAKSKMTLELLVSDVHVGKLTDRFNHEVLKSRLEQLTHTTVKEMEKASEHHTVERVIVAFLGDLIESQTFHGVESAKGCEFGNSRQIQECLTHLFHLVLVPIAQAAAKYGAKVDVIGITGNHDRTETDKTYNNPGEDNVTWIIYKAMEEFTKLAGLKNVTWLIPKDPFQFISIYGEGCLYEHYDNAKGNSRIALESLMAKRVNQLKKAIRFMRGGHFHEPTEYGVGKIMVNGNVPGNDGYSTVLGFDCEPSQTLNFYIERRDSDVVSRETSFYKKLLIQLS